MPNARLNALHRKSRSPIPPADGYTSSQRPFLPPSHYAAAAGIPYNMKSHTPSNQSDFSEGTALVDGRPDPQEYHSAFMPVSYPSELEVISDSSFGLKSATGSRYGSSAGEKRQSSAKPPIRPQSHIAGLPLLETNLLPSLRDTIDRMTRTPSIAASSSSPSSSVHLDVPRQSNSLRSTRSVSPSSPQPSCSNTSHHISVNVPTNSGDPESTYASQDQPRPPPAEPLTPRSKFPQKSAPKSALRAPTPKLFSDPSPVAKPIAGSPSMGASLKSMRSILRRKASSAGLSGSPAPSGVADQKPILKENTRQINQSSRPHRGRSRTDLKDVSSPDPHPSVNGYDSTIKMQTPHSPKNLEGRKSKPSSGIPRLQSRSDRKIWSEGSRTDDSDLEYRYETEGRERRRLVVANAEVFASSSESEVESKKALWRGTIRNDKPREVRDAVGLGFDFRLASKSGYLIREHEDLPQRQDVWYPDDTEIGKPDDHDHSAVISEQIHDTPPNGYSTYSDGDDCRRQVALLGIVSSLDLNGTTTEAREGEESEYCGEEGFAVSGSAEFIETAIQAATNDINATGICIDRPMDKNKSQSHSLRDRQTGRPRSSSCTPTFVLSNQDDGVDDRFVYGEPSLHRPRSVQKYPIAPATSRNLSSKGKSPSRSPVIRQGDAIPMPAALRRHSVYHHSPSPGPMDESLKVDKHYTSLSESSQERYGTDTSDAATIAQHSHAAAARERRAFGIPLSGSVELYHGVDRRNSRILTHAESDLSSVGSMYWNEEVSELSPGAETLFRKLSGGSAKERDYQQRILDDFTRMDAISNSSSAASVYEDENIEDSWQKRGTSLNDHAEDIRVNLEPPLRNGSSITSCDDLEVKRQELIREFCQTEETFVNRLQNFVRLFVLPLRVKDSKTWISGVPSQVARLFDWLDDIMNLHIQLLSSIQSIQTTQYPVVERIAGSILTFIPRLEVYQPYLVRLSDVTNLIYDLLQDEKSDFGEFVAIQEGAPECDGWKFDRFLVEPINRLAKYPEFFSRLISLTPRSHTDYLSTFFLIHSTDMIIRVMTEVKAHEDEYNMIKRLSIRIQGLPPAAQLATRERRLLLHGTLYLTSIDGKQVATLPDSQPTPKTFQDGYSATHGGNKRPNKLANAINEWDARRGRSESTSSSSTGTSFGSFGTSSIASSDTPITPCSTFFPSFRIPMPEGRLNNSKISIPEQKRALASLSPNPRHTTPDKILVQAFVFTDLILLATPTSSSTTEDGNWNLLQDIGITRCIGVNEPVERDSYDSGTITLETLPVDANKLNESIENKDGPIITIGLAIPTHNLTVSEKPLQRDSKASSESWIPAFRQCFRSTLRSISLPPHLASYGGYSDRERDTQHTVFSLLASGLPFPKSPSFQLADVQDGQPNDLKVQEREERGWWSLRFQQVFRELQRQDVSP